MMQGFYCRISTEPCKFMVTKHASYALSVTKDEFIDQGRELSPEEAEIQKAVFGPCMNIVSGCVQICKLSVTTHAIQETLTMYTKHALASLA
ncbi:hypothetical protein DPMN_028940 [Dreissena polymorpha]|uniref:Uncharacterized protein n=1 Tax=Dreissena polymorpha TaxID=45954 RepID=A0A9D4LXU6_DREPO|nr:hypothetical protein DPMN_028940 [Dreissena polymorpha]